MKKYQSFINEERKLIGFECTDCGEHAKEFYVKDSLWYQVMPEYKQKKVICIPCFEERLGRKLKKSDFKIGWEHYWRERTDWDENYWNNLEEKVMFTEADPYGEEEWPEEKSIKKWGIGHFKIVKDENLGYLIVKDKNVDDYYMYHSAYIWNFFTTGPVSIRKKDNSEITKEQAISLIEGDEKIYQYEEKMGYYISVYDIDSDEVKKDVLKFLNDKVAVVENFDIELIDPYGEEEWGDEPKWKLMKHIKNGYYKIFKKDNRGIYYEYYFYGNYPHLYKGNIEDFKEITKKQAKELLNDLYGIKQEEEVASGKVIEWYSLSRITVPQIKIDLTEFLKNKIEEQNEAIRWYHKGKLGSPEMEPEKPAYQLVLYDNKIHSLYIVQKYINDKNMIIFDNLRYNMSGFTKISDVFFPISDEDRQSVLGNGHRISIFNKEIERWDSMYYEDLIKKYPKLKGNI